MNVRRSAALAATFPAAWRLALLCAIFATFLAFPPPAFGAEFQVTSDQDPGDGVCDATCTLREAITAANASGPGDMITFDEAVFPSATPVTITISNMLPALSSGGDTIDAAGAGVIVDIADAQDRGPICILLQSNGNTVRGLQLSDCSDGISIVGDNNVVGPDNVFFDSMVGIFVSGAGSTGNVIKGNKIGTNATGTAVHPEGGNATGISTTGANNIIGGTSTADRNIISGNTQGLSIGGAGVSGNMVFGNYIGTTVTGLAGIPNGTGISMNNGASSNVIGGLNAGERNLISGNTTANISIGGGSDNNSVINNLVGPDVSGGGTLTNAVGVILQGSSGNPIMGNIIGPDNVISDNSSQGVLLSGSDVTGNTMKGNLIGTDPAGTAGVPNGIGVSISLSAASNTIGGTTPGDGNTIAFNTNEGVKVDGAASTGNAIRGNSIHDNGLAEILLANGGNGFLGEPLDLFATATSVGGTACSSCEVDVFSDDGNDAEVYQGSATAAGDGTFFFSGVIAGPNVTATNTDAGGNTSPLGAPVPISPDTDADGIPDSLDNCPTDANQDQTDGDGDMAGDACDNCLTTPNADQNDVDADAVGDLCDNCESTDNGPAESQILGVGNQTDSDGDGVPGMQPPPGATFGGDACDADDDNDGIPDTMDVCRTLAEDYDGFEDGDTCPDVDNDSDGVCDPGQTSVSCSGSDSGQTCFDPAGTLSCPTIDCRNVAEDGDAFKDNDGCPEPDNDNDGVSDLDDPCDGSDAVAGADGMLGSPQDLNHNGVRDMATEGVFTLDDLVQVFEDYDGVLDTDGCHDSPGEDFDGDGFTDDAEALDIGTNPGYPCGPSGWPADLAGNDNKLNIGDFNSFLFPLRDLNGNTIPGEPGPPPGGDDDGDGVFNKFNHPVPDPNDTNIARWNLQSTGPGAADINIGDLNALNPAVTAPTSRPPMFGGQPAFFTNGGQCPLSP